MEDQLISFETALLAKEKGLKHEMLITSSAYNENGKLGSIFASDDVYVILAPTQSLLQKWLREEHKINIEVIPNWDVGNVVDCFIYTIYHNKIHEPLSSFNSYEEALEAGLQEALKLL